MNRLLRWLDAQGRIFINWFERWMFRAPAEHRVLCWIALTAMGALLLWLGAILIYKTI